MKEQFDELELWRHDKKSEEKRRERKEKERKSERKSIWCYVILMAIMGLILISRLCFFDVNQVSGISMYPTLNDKDLLFVQKFDTVSVSRYDIVTVRAEEADGKSMLIIKRVYGLPGETIEIYTDGSVWINGVRLSDEYQILTSDESVTENTVEYRTVLGVGEYYVLGDNRAVSQDSRYYGAFHRDDIKGIVFCRFHPFVDISETSVVLENE